MAQIARDTEERVNAAVLEAQKDSFNRLHECVTRISERLNDPKAIFRDSLIENARELTDVLTRLNVADDPRLEELRKRVEELAQVSPEALRTLPFQRATTAKTADQILADMQAVFGELTA
jgi:ABC-type transporter Mla subunit MlaD